MANQFLTLKDITAADHLGDPSSVGIVDNIVNVAPELDRILGRPIAGISYEALILTALGSNAGFRKIGSGVPKSAPSIDLKRFNCFPFDCQMDVGEDLLISRQAEGDSPAYLFTIHATAAARQKALLMGKQFYLGSLNDPNGPAGLMDFLFTQRTQVDSRTGLKIDQVVDCGGTIAGSCQTIWFVRMGPQDICWLFGQGRGIIMNPWVRLPGQPSPDSTTGAPKYRTAWLSNMFGYIGTSMANYHAVSALINVDVTNGTVAPTNGAGGNGLWTDTVIADLYAKIPISQGDRWIAFCTKKAATMLQKQRAVTNFVDTGERGFTTGIAPLGDFPTKLPTFGNCPLVVTDSIFPANQIILN